MPVSTYLPEHMGSAMLAPSGPFVAGSRAELTLVYTAGTFGIDDSGMLKVSWRTTSDMAEHELQLQVYTDAGRREGLDVRGAYVHDLKAGRRGDVPVDPAAITAAETTVSIAAESSASAGRTRARNCSPASVSDTLRVVR